MTIIEVLKVIKSDFLKKEILELRKELSSGNNDFYKQNKLKLPAVTFCATFDTKRTKKNLKKYNELIVIDIDKLIAEEIEKVRNFLQNDEYVFSFWKSPSNKGFKGLINLNYLTDFEKNNIDLHHKFAFQTLSKHFKEKYDIELDNSGSDITRLCFLSYDENLVYKENAKPFKINNSEIQFFNSKNNKRTEKLYFSSNKDALYNSKDRNNQYDRKLMSTLIRYLNNKNISITENYENWYKTAMAISNSFTYDVGINYFLKLSKRDSNKYNEIECMNFLNNCYENRNGKINLASIIYIANQKGFKTKYQKNGVTKAEE